MNKLANLAKQGNIAAIIAVLLSQHLLMTIEKAVFTENLKSQLTMIRV
jgi:hypothetical protein